MRIGERFFCFKAIPVVAYDGSRSRPSFGEECLPIGLIVEIASVPSLKGTGHICCNLKIIGPEELIPKSVQGISLADSEIIAVVATDDLHAGARLLQP